MVVVTGARNQRGDANVDDARGDAPVLVAECQRTEIAASMMVCTNAAMTLDSLHRPLASRLTS